MAGSMDRRSMSEKAGSTAVLDFLESIRTPEFPISTQQYIAVGELLMEIARKGEWPEHVSGLRELIAPIVCCSRTDQAYFYKRFDEHFGRAEPDSHPEPPLVPVRPERSSFWLEHGLKVKFAAITLVLVACSFLIHRYLNQPPKTTPGVAQGRVILENGTPVSKATLRYLGQTANTGTIGEFSIAFDASKVPFRVLVTSGPLKPGSFPIDSASPPSQSVRLTERGQHETAIRKEGQVEPKWLTVPTRGEQRLERWFPAILALTIVVPILILLGYFYRLLENRTQLRRWTTTLAPRVQEIGAQNDTKDVLRTSTLQRVATALLRYVARESTEIDAVGTIAKTVDAGGYFTLVYKRYQTRAGYLFLIHRLGTPDPQAPPLETLANRLRRSFLVSIDTYFYSSDPRACFRAANTKRGRPQHSTLQELAVAHPYQVLCVFDEGRPVLNHLPCAAA